VVVREFPNFSNNISDNICSSSFHKEPLPFALTILLLPGNYLFSSVSDKIKQVIETILRLDQIDFMLTDVFMRWLISISKSTVVSLHDIVKNNSYSILSIPNTYHFHGLLKSKQLFAKLTLVNEWKPPK
jgi:hypothetical protein